MKPIRVLQVFASLDRGGAETMLMNIYRSIDREKVQFDFVVNDRIDEYSYESEIAELGGRVFRIPSYQLTNHLSYKKSWKKLLVQHPEWKIIHAHHTAPAFIYLRVAKKLQRITIAHSHSAGGEKTLKSAIRILMRYPLRYVSKYLFACSKEAAEWMFGEKSSKTYILNNAIDTKKFVFNQKLREDKRKEFKIKDKFVMGHIGRFDLLKNHEFLIDVFKLVSEKNKDAILMLVGEGELKETIKKKVNDSGLTNQVVFTGLRSDIPELLQAMDVFVFPSIYEGLGIVVIEAQATGLPCVITDTLPKEVALTDLVERESLESRENWSEKILTHAVVNERINAQGQIKSKGYDIKETTPWLEEFYINLIRD